jgi:hypothetical protein
MPSYDVSEDVNIGRLGDAQFGEISVSFKAGKHSAKEGTKDEAALEHLVQIGLAKPVKSSKES